MPRNPHGDDRLAGGSSTGTAVAVATGIVPFGIGTDGGGSIRIPSSLNGVFGIKPTWGRVSRDGELGGGSVAHVGPIASTTLDLAVALEVVAGPDERDRQTFGSPEVVPGEFTAACTRSVKGLRIGVDKTLWKDAAPDVERACEDALLALERAGAVRVSIATQLAPFAAPIGYLSIGPEALAACRAYFVAARTRFTPDLELSFSVLNELSLHDYLMAARLREGLRLEMVRHFGDIDALALPATLSTAPRATDAEMAGGLVDSTALDALCRPNFLGNLTGLPALSAPVGQDKDGLPIGLQLVGDAWDEATLFCLSAELERQGIARAPKPKHSVNILA
jgi:aspartyl-tRNA(Asn)/glutamyl-tRNA(Gln) amidotransferase subunit A